MGGGGVGRARDAPLRPPGIELLPVNSNSDALLQKHLVMLAQIDLT